MHGYDIVDHNTLNPEIGTEADYNALSQALQSHGMGQVLDVVPNHMGVASDDNAWWMDVLENGPGSPYASFFDIDWMPLKPDLAYKVLLAHSGRPVRQSARRAAARPVVRGGGLLAALFRPPPADRAAFLGDDPQPADRRTQRAARATNTRSCSSIKASSRRSAILPPRNETDPEKVSERRREKEVIKRRLAELVDRLPRGQHVPSGECGAL